MKAELHSLLRTALALALEVTEGILTTDALRSWKQVKVIPYFSIFQSSLESFFLSIKPDHLLVEKILVSLHWLLSPPLHSSFIKLVVQKGLPYS